MLALAATLGLGFVAGSSFRAGGVIFIVALTVTLHGLVAALCGAPLSAILGAVAIAVVGCNLGLIASIFGALAKQARA